MDEVLDMVEQLVHQRDVGWMPHRRALADQSDKILVGVRLPGDPFDALGYLVQLRYREPGQRLRLAVPGDQVSGQVAGGPTGAQRRLVGAELQQKVAEFPPLLLRIPFLRCQSHHSQHSSRQRSGRASARPRQVIAG